MEFPQQEENRAPEARLQTPGASATGGQAQADGGQVRSPHEPEWKKSAERITEAVQEEGSLIFGNLQNLRAYYAERTPGERMLFHFGLLAGLLLGWAALSILPWWAQFVLVFVLGWMAWKTLRAAAAVEWKSKKGEKQGESRSLDIPR